MVVTIVFPAWCVKYKSSKMAVHFIQWYIIFGLCIISTVNSSDITNLVFGQLTDGMPAAFGDFNSDELTDVFVLRDNGRTVEIFLAAEEEPLLRQVR